MDWQPIDRWLAGEATQDEASAVEQWLAADPDRADLLDGLRLLRATHLDRTSATDAAWAKLARAIEPRDADRRQPRPSPARRRPWYVLPLSLAAGIVALAGGWRLASHFGGSPVAEAVAPAGGIRRMDLPDGTRVVLFPGTHLRVPRGFGRTEREVELRGRAYFEVTHDPERPFTVRASHTRTRVLGTRFVVSDDGGDGGRVVVAEGRVAFWAASDAAKGVEVPAGQEGILSPDGEVRVRPADVEAALGFTTGRLSMRDVSFREAAREVSHWYGVGIREVAPPLADRRIRLSLPAGARLEEALEALAAAADAAYEQADDSIVFTAK